MLTVIEFMSYEDVRGNPQRAKAGEFTVSRKTAKGINWAAVAAENIPKVIDKAWMVPGGHYQSD